MLVPLFCPMLLSGCIKVGPDFLRPKTAVSPKWLEAGDQRLKAGPADYRAWWKEFNDPALDLIIDRAYGANLSRGPPGCGCSKPAPNWALRLEGLSPNPAAYRLPHLQPHERSVALRGRVCERRPTAT